MHTKFGGRLILCPEKLTATFRRTPENKRNQNVTHEKAGVCPLSSLLSLFVLSSALLQSKQMLIHTAAIIYLVGESEQSGQTIGTAAV